MTKNILFLLVITSSLFFSCQQKTGSTAASSSENTTKSGLQQFGEKITLDDAITYDAMIAQMGTQDSMSVKVKGLVSGVCQAKGCWMNIVAEGDNKPEMFVKFKDYGFFMPMDLAGKEVVMEGKAYREMTSVDELRHYAEDEGKSKEEIEKITEPVEELKFMASGVVIVP